MAFIIQLFRFIFGFMYIKRKKEKRLKSDAIKLLLEDKNINKSWVKELEQMELGDFLVEFMALFFVKYKVDISFELYKEILPLISVPEIKDLKYEFIKFIEEDDSDDFYRHAYSLEADIILDYRHDKSHVSNVSGGHNGTAVSTSILEYNHHKGMAIRII